MWRLDLTRYTPREIFLMRGKYNAKEKTNNQLAKLMRKFSQVPCNGPRPEAVEKCREVQLEKAISKLPKDQYPVDIRACTKPARQARILASDAEMKTYGIMAIDNVLTRITAATDPVSIVRNFES